MPPKSDAAVQAYLKRQADLDLLREELVEQKRVHSFAVFENEALKKQASVAAARNRHSAELELECMNKEVTLRRNAQLKELYEREEQIHAQELEAKGLAFVKERL